ncbi:MAG: SH3 domain-containing protein [Clostridia bacterium]|nr:SH3 domain-containing protein [Clostridia bacterium]
MTKKICGKLMLMLCLAVLLVAGISTPQLYSHALSLGQASVIATKTSLYTSADFSSEKVTILDEDEQPVLITLKLNDSVEISQIQEDFAYVTTSKGYTGWMYKYYLSQNDAQDVYPVFNATIRTDTIIYDIDKTSTSQLALAGSRVYIYDGFDKNQEYTAVQVVLEDTSLYVGYIATADVEPDGVSKMLIVAITVIIAAVTIVLSLVFIKKKKKKKEKKLAK